MISSGLIMPFFWIMCLFVANASAQKVTSTLPSSNRTCAGTRIFFNCSITGSSTVRNLIIGWSSPEYIGEGTFLEFTTADMMGESTMSMIYAGVTAKLLYNGDRSGIPTLESQLQLTASSNFTNPTILCRSSFSGTITRITFNVLNFGIPGIPHDAKGTEVPLDGRCLLFVTWEAPLDYGEENIDYYFINSPSTDIRTNEKSTFVSLIIPNCIPDLNVSVSAVDRCGREGPSNFIVLHLDSSTQNETLPTRQVTTPQENQSGPDVDAVIAIIIAVIASILTMLLAIVLVILICYFRKRLEDYDLRHQGPHEELISLVSYDDHDKIAEGERLLRLCSNGCTAEARDFKSLLDKGVDPNLQDEDGYHPLWYASHYGKRDLVELFLQYKADVNLMTNDGWTALQLASYSGHTDVVKLLVDSHAQIDNKDNDGWTALHRASYKGHTEVVKLLIDSCAQIDNKDNDGWTALHRASYKGHTEVVKLLIDSCAQIDNKDNDGWTALHLASNNGHTDVVKLLVDSDAQIDNKHRDGWTALQLASFSGHTGVVKLLVDFGAKIDNKSELVKFGQIIDSDHLFHELSFNIQNRYMEIGIELGLKVNYLTNQLESGQMGMLQGNMKAMKMLVLWKNSVAEYDCTYSALAAALEKHGFRDCAKKYCYTSI